jgi:hypothetical protein
MSGPYPVTKFFSPGDFVVWTAGAVGTRGCVIGTITIPHCEEDGLGLLYKVRTPAGNFCGYPYQLEKAEAFDLDAATRAWERAEPYPLIENDGEWQGIDSAPEQVWIDTRKDQGEPERVKKSGTVWFVGHGTPEAMYARRNPTQWRHVEAGRPHVD